MTLGHLAIVPRTVFIGQAITIRLPIRMVSISVLQTSPSSTNTIVVLASLSVALPARIFGFKTDLMICY